MNIRWKVGALIATLFVVLGVSELFVAVKVLIPSFADLERSEASVAMRRVHSGVDRSLEQLAGSATSWGNWADTYRFAHDHNRVFVNENLTIIGLQQLAINSLVVMDLRGKIIASAALDLQSGDSADLNLLGQVVSRADFPWLTHLVDGRAARGILQTPKGPMLVAAAPILDGFGRGPPRGMVLMGRFLSAGEITNLGSQAQVALSVISPPMAVGQAKLVETQDNTAIYESLNDIYDNPAVTFRVDLPREITRRGTAAVYYSTAVLMGTAVVILVLLILTLNRVVLSPLGRVIRYAESVGESSKPTNELDTQRSDEIGSLARALNRMVGRLADSSNQLVDRSFEAGFSELAKGVLHNLGNAMTPIGVRLARLQDRLDSIEDADFRLAALQLGDAQLDAERRIALAELLQLAGDSLSANLSDAREDVEVILRQTSVVQEALAEQMRSTHNEHVWEVVRIPDLLTQAMEVVPDAARRRLLLRMDDSVDQVGSICVPRTVLRLVLQNIMINAADSIGETGRPRGTLQIAVQVSCVAEREQLVLRCADDGAGIAADSLTRIFEKGFSTKSRQTNFGIGLHWCANALGALGGQVWATSEGVGRGACIHVLIPLRESQQRAVEAA
jgi:two-component system, NtrC family, sensor kinase